MASTEWVIIDCPGCTEKLKVSRPSSGEVMRCPECDHLFEVPHFEDAKEAVAVKVAVAVRAEEKEHSIDEELELEPVNQPPAPNSSKDHVFKDFATATSDMDLGELEPDSQTPVLFSNPEATRSNREDGPRPVEIRPSTARTPSLTGKYFEHIIAPSTVSAASDAGARIGDNGVEFQEFKARIKTADKANEEHASRGERKRVWKYRANGEDEGDSIGDYAPPGNQEALATPSSSAPGGAGSSIAEVADSQKAPTTKPGASSSSSSARAGRGNSGSSSNKSIRFSRGNKPPHSHWARFRAAWILVGVIAVVGLIFLIRSKLESASQTAAANSKSQAEAVSRRLEKQKPPESGLPEEMGSPENFIKLVRPVIESFLAAETIDERVKYVRNPVQARTRMIGFYKRNPERNKANPLEEFQDGMRSTGNLSMVSVKTENGELRPIWLAKQEDDSYLVDWESFVQYSDMEWEQFVKEKPIEGQYFMVRLKLREERAYFAYDFDDPNTYRCWFVEFPRTDKTVWAYTPRNDSKIDKAMFEVMEKQYARNFNLESYARIKLAFPENAKTDNQVIVTEYLGTGWTAEEKTQESEAPKPTENPDE